MMLVVVMLVVLPTSAAETPDPPPTFSYEDFGHPLRCTLCPPGTHMRAPCTRSRPTECLPCPSGQYTQYWNYLHRCLPCRAPCDHNQRERHECTPTTDRECECVPGYHWRADRCARHTRCSPGFGAIRTGTTHTDTECERCPQGTFSEGNSEYAKCKPHTGCSGSLFKVFRGTSWHDDVCVSCSQLRDGGGIALLQGILPTFFTQKLRNGKLKRFVRLLETQKRQWRSGSSKQDLLYRLNEWTQRAQDHQLWKLPEMLENLQLHNIAKKLRKMLKDFQDPSYCTDKDVEKSG
ncbi:tumor necrosis factor receptor superfamily member 6B-like [Colossoma macropomum]|uniref:tumor necrosis factor receptor superfamily member 6B-like n=1 Tax=Colossoma macropomum TaxID=42526 RepID=UPI0018643D54|nr:tumor necrosis factor receptor superfamily member 6B-like [Colossoma macropomum]